MGKKIVGIDVGNYTFDKTNKTITFLSTGTLSLEQILLITNVTDNIIIYNFADVTKGGVLTNNVLTLNYDTSGMENTDKLQIYIWHKQFAASGDSIIVVDKDDGYGAKVNAAGNLLVSTIAVVPDNKTTVKRTHLSVVSGDDYVEDSYSIPNGETLKIQFFMCGAEGDINKYSKVTLYYAPNGIIDGNEEIIVMAYMGDNFAFDLCEDFIGDGTNKIITRLVRMDAGDREMFARWVGYY